MVRHGLGSLLARIFRNSRKHCTLWQWSQDDLVRIAAMKLTDAARVFYNATLELHDKDNAYGI